MVLVIDEERSPKLLSQSHDVTATNVEVAVLIDCGGQG
jgi:hypothetical protein